MDTNAMKWISAVFVASTLAAPAAAIDPDNRAPDVRLDLRKTPCPLSPIRTARALKRMKPGQILEVLGTSKMARRRSPWLAKKLGHIYMGSYDDPEGAYHLFFTRG